jgi:hypothetical protein
VVVSSVGELIMALFMTMVKSAIHRVECLPKYQRDGIIVVE